MKSLKLCCALCKSPDRGLLLFIVSQTSIFTCRAREELQDNHWSIVHAFVVWWQASYVTKAAGDCSVPNAPMPSLFVPVSVSYSKIKRTHTLYFLAFCNGFIFNSLCWPTNHLQGKMIFITKVAVQKLILEIYITWCCLLLVYKTFYNISTVELPVKVYT